MILKAAEGNNIILEALKKDEPFLAARVGSIELDALIKSVNYPNSPWTDNLKYLMFNNTGFFPAEDEPLNIFCSGFLKDLESVDLLGLWKGEDFLSTINYKKASLAELRSLEPYYHENPWTQALENKKVLVIHPYEESIEKQFNIRTLLFKDPRILPNFKLETIKAVQSIAGNKTEFSSWFDAYNYLCNQIKLKDFDVAIIGAGSYGLPLAAFVKRFGKKAIHIGGATQILFGIKGKRWDEHDVISTFYNEHWVRPDITEIPSNYKNIEEGCYW